jgi:hypothetical protein
MNALSELEGALHFTMEEIGRRFKRGRIGTRDIRGLIWAGLLHEDEDLTLRQVGDWLNEAGFLKDEKTRDTLLEKVFNALSESFPEAAKKAAKDDGAATVEAADPN